MKYSQEMILKSPSGYCMPFEERDKEVEMSLGYGKQVHPKTGAEFFHHGVDFNAPHYLLSAVASGIVSGIGNDSVHGAYLVIRYGDYEVTYGHLSSILASYGERVDAGATVGVSDAILHMETRYKGEEFDPIEFLTMIYGNIKSVERQKQPFGKQDFSAAPEGFRTKYDKDADEIEELMLRFFPNMPVFGGSPLQPVKKSLSRSFCWMPTMIGRSDPASLNARSSLRNVLTGSIRTVRSLSNRSARIPVLSGKRSIFKTVSAGSIRRSFSLSGLTCIKVNCI